MDQIATAAAVSKQTVYKYFICKQRLFAAMVLAATGPVEVPLPAVTRSLQDTDDVDRVRRGSLRCSLL